MAVLLKFYFFCSRSKKLLRSSSLDCLKSESLNLIGTVVEGNTDSCDWSLSLFGDFFNEPELAIWVFDCLGELLMLRSRWRNISWGLNFCFKWLSMVYLRPKIGFTVATVFLKSVIVLTWSEKILSCSSWGLKGFLISSCTFSSIPFSFKLNSLKYSWFSSVYPIISWV